MGNTLECCTQSVNVDTNDLSSDEDDETYKLLHNPITKGGDHGGIKDGNKQSNKHNHKHPKRGKHKDRAIKRIKKKAQYSKGKKRNKSKNESDTEVTMIWVDEELYKSDMEHDDNDNNTPSHEMKMISPSNDSDDSSESVISPSSNDSSSSDETDSDSDSDSNTDSDTDTDSSSGSTSDSDSNSEANTEQHHVEGPQTEIEAINNVDSNRNDIHGHVMQKTYINVDMDSLDKEMMAILSKENVNTPNNLNNLPPGDPGLGNHHSQESHHKMLSLIKGISTDILEQSGILARDDEKKEVQLQQNEEEINPVLPLNLPLPEAPKNNNMRMKKSRSRERKSKQEQYEALRKELDDAEIRLKQSKHEKKILQKENSALRQENHVLKTSDKDSAAAPSMVGNQSLSPDVAPCSPITIKITTTTKTFQYTPSQLPAMDSLNGFELNPGSNQMYSIAENPHEYEHGFGTNTSNTSNTSLLADQAFVE